MGAQVGPAPCQTVKSTGVKSQTKTEKVKKLPNEANLPISLTNQKRYQSPNNLLFYGLLVLNLSVVDFIGKSRKVGNII